MTTELWSLLGVVVGAFLGAGITLLGDYMAFRRTRAESEKSFRLLKLEELSSLLAQSAIDEVRLYGKLLGPVDNERTEVPMGRIQLLVTVYAPVLQKRIDDLYVLENRRTKVGLQIFESKTATGKMTENQRTEMNGIISEYFKTVEIAQQELAEIVKDIVKQN